MALKTPAPSLGDILPPADLLGHLLLIAPTEYQTGIITKYTKAGDEPSDAIACDVAVLTSQREDGTYGPIYRGVLWFNVGLRMSLRKSIADTANGDAVLARMGQGQGKPGQDPPYTLVDAMTDTDAVAFAERWLADNPEYMLVAQNEARRAASQTGAPTPPPAGQPVPGVAMDAGPAATAPSVAPVPTVPTPAASKATGPVALPGMGGQVTQGGGAAAVPAASVDLLAALSPAEKAQMLAALQAEAQ